MTSPKILLIEDNPGDAALVRESIGSLDGVPAQVEHVVCLEDGLRALKDGQYHMVLLDLSLPDSHGLEGLEQIRRHHPHVPVVILTGSDNPRLRTELLQAGASKYLTKGHVLTEVFRYAEMWHDVLEGVRHDDQWSALREIMYAPEAGPHSTAANLQSPDRPIPSIPVLTEWIRAQIELIAKPLTGSKAPTSNALLDSAVRTMAEQRLTAEVAVQCFYDGIEQALASAEISLRRELKSHAQKLLNELLIKLCNKYRTE